MKGAARRKVSYVVDACETQHAHRLGVNSLAIDPNNAVLYSAGRDGVVAGWNLHIQLDSNETSKVPRLLCQYLPFSRLHSLPMPHRACFHSSILTGSTTFASLTTTLAVRSNDPTTLDNFNFAVVVTASSDRTIKAWHDANEAAHTVGWHTDYVKCLASADGSGWVASAGFDKRIKLWDIERCEALLTMGAKQEDEGIRREPA